MRFPGGGCGDFLTYQISQDANYYPTWNHYIDSTNAWRLTANQPTVPDVKLNHYIAQPEYLDAAFPDKHLILGTHIAYDNLKNIPRIERRRLTAKTPHLLFFYTLLWLKNLQPTLLALPPNIDLYHQIQIHWLTYRMQHTTGSQKITADQNAYNYPTLDVGELFFNTTNELVETWRVSFDMQQPISLTAIQEHHQLNLELVANNLTISNWNSPEEVIAALVTYIQNK